MNKKFTIPSKKKKDLFGGEEWYDVSNEAKDLIKNMLVYDVKKRLNLQ